MFDLNHVMDVEKVDNGDDYEFIKCEDYASELKRMRERIKWEDENERREFHGRLGSLISDWKGPLPNLREIFRREEIDWLLLEDIKNYSNAKRFPFVDFVIETDYRDEPETDEDGKPILRRTTAVHRLSEVIEHHDIGPSLFEIYDSFAANYMDESGYTHFHAACEFGYSGVVAQFLLLGQDPDQLWQGESSLHLVMGTRASEKNQKKVVELLLRGGADPNLAHSHGSTFLHMICQRQNGNDLAELLFKISDEKRRLVHVDAPNKWSRTPLHYALARGHKKAVELLLQRGSNPNLANEHGETPLHLISRINHYDSVALLEILFDISDEKHQTIKIDAKDKWSRTPLHYALDTGHKKAAELLLRRGADPNLVNEDGSTSLHLICGRSDDESAMLLQLFFEIRDEKQQPIQIDAVDKSGRTPLHYALVRGHKKAVELLLRRGANPNSANERRSTCLHMICERNYDDSVALLKTLFEISDERRQIIKIDPVDEWSRTPLHYALNKGRKELAELLLRRGASPSFADEDEKTPLHLICEMDDDDVTTTFLTTFFEIVKEKKQTIQIDAKDELGRTPLHYALKTGLKGVAELLLRRGANPNAADDDGETPLHLACRGCKKDDLARSFFKINDDMGQTVERIDARDSRGRTPLQWAVASLLPNAVDALLNRGADLSGFVFPSEDYFAHGYTYVGFQLASNALAVVEVLENKGYELSRADAHIVMSTFRKAGLFDEFACLDDSWMDDEKFASESKNVTACTSLSLHDLIRLPAGEAEKSLKAHADRATLAERLCSSANLDSPYKEACLAHLSETIARGFCRRWALVALAELTRNKLPSSMYERFVDGMINEDLFVICARAAD